MCCITTVLVAARRSLTGSGNVPLYGPLVDLQHGVDCCGRCVCGVVMPKARHGLLDELEKCPMRYGRSCFRPLFGTSSHLCHSINAVWKPLMYH